MNKSIDTLSAKDRAEVIEIVGIGFETGHHVFKDEHDFKTFKTESGFDNPSKAWEFYWNCVNLGPVGFLETFCDEYCFSDDFLNEYGGNMSEQL